MWLGGHPPLLSPPTFHCVARMLAPVQSPASWAGTDLRPWMGIGVRHGWSPPVGGGHLARGPSKEQTQEVGTCPLPLLSLAQLSTSCSCSSQPPPGAGQPPPGAALRLPPPPDQPGRLPTFLLTGAPAAGRSCAQLHAVLHLASDVGSGK